MVITRINSSDYQVVTDTVMSDGNLRGDCCCRLTGTVLKSHEQPGTIRTGGLLVVRLGPKSLHSVCSLGIGDSATF